MASVEQSLADIPLEEILQKAVETRASFSGEPQRFKPNGLVANQISRTVIDDMTSTVAEFTQCVQAIRASMEGLDTLAEHPWAGVGNACLSELEVGYLAGTLEVWQKSVVDLGKVVFGFAKSNRTHAIAAMDIPALEQLAGLIADIPKLTGQEIWEELKSLQGERVPKARMFLDALQNLLQIEVVLGRVLKPWDMLDQELVHRHVKAGLTLSQTLDSHSPLRAVADLIDAVEGISLHIQSLAPAIARLREEFAALGETTFTRSFSGMRELSIALEHIAGLPQQYWPRLHVAFDGDDFDGALEELASLIEPLRRQQSELQSVFVLDGLPSADSVEKLIAVASAGHKLNVFDAEKRAARQALQGITVSSDIALDTIRAHIPKLRQFQLASAALEQRDDLVQALGPAYQGLETDLRTAQSIRLWVTRLRQEYGSGTNPRAGIATGIISLSVEAVTELRKVYLVHAGQLHENLSNLGVLRSVLNKQHSLLSDQADLQDPETGLAQLVKDLQQVLSQLKSIVGDDALTVGQVHERINLHRRLNRDHAKWQSFRSENDIFTRLLLDISCAGEHTELPQAEATLAVAEAFERMASSRYRNVLLPTRDEETYRRLLSFIEKLPELLTAERQQRQAFAQLAAWDAKKWLVKGETIKAIHDRNKLALSEEDSLTHWVEYLSAQRKMQEFGLSVLADALANNELSANDAELALHAGIYDFLAAEALDHPDAPETIQ
ncbi:MAG: hypothetical protein ACSHXK_02695 [Oceanococcus sp.]